MCLLHLSNNVHICTHLISPLKTVKSTVTSECTVWADSKTHSTRPKVTRFIFLEREVTSSLPNKYANLFLTKVSVFTIAVFQEKFSNALADLKENYVNRYTIYLVRQVLEKIFQKNMISRSQEMWGVRKCFDNGYYVYTLKMISQLLKIKFQKLK